MVPRGTSGPPPRLLALLQLYSSWECSPVWVDSLGIAGTGGSMQLRKGQSSIAEAPPALGSPKHITW